MYSPGGAKSQSVGPPASRMPLTFFNLGEKGARETSAALPKALRKRRRGLMCSFIAGLFNFPVIPQLAFGSLLHFNCESASRNRSAVNEDLLTVVGIFKLIARFFINAF